MKQYFSIFPLVAKCLLTGNRKTMTRTTAETIEKMNIIIIIIIERVMWACHNVACGMYGRIKYP